MRLTNEGPRSGGKTIQAENRLPWPIVAIDPETGKLLEIFWAAPKRQSKLPQLSDNHHCRAWSGQAIIKICVTGRTMRRLDTRPRRWGMAVFRLNIPNRFSQTSAALFLCFFFVVGAQRGLGQCDGCTTSPAARVLGVHNDGGRGCAGCHASHSGSLDPAAKSENIALWGSVTTPSYGSDAIVGDPEYYVQVAPARVASPEDDVAGILLCLSCHDGNVTPQTMMPSQSYSSKVGLLNFGRKPIPTLLGEDPLASEYSFEHPLGAEATVTLGNGLGFANGVFSVKSGSPYAHFMENYGLPLMVPGTRSFSFGVNGEGQPISSLHHLPQPARHVCVFLDPDQSHSR